MKTYMEANLFVFKCEYRSTAAIAPVNSNPEVKYEEIAV